MKIKSNILLSISILMVAYLPRLAKGSACKAFQCNENITHCAEAQDTTVYLNPDACAETDECFFTGNDYGRCAPKIDRTFPTNLYPGYNCMYKHKPGICAFGDKYCNLDGKCVGGVLNDHCQRHADCYYGYYCSQYGRCVPNRKENETCTINEACERGYLCYFPETRSFYGNCTKILSLDTDYPVLPEYNRQVYEQEGMEKLCSSGWYNRTTGKCFAGVKSIQKGSVCSTDLDCPTTVSDIFAQCKCGFSSKGQKYCDIEGDDDEWILVREKFTNYSDSFANCHQAEGFGECFFNEYFKAWKCAELEARLYVYFIDLPDCWDGIKHQHPIFAEWAHYCHSCYIKALQTLAVFGMYLLSFYILDP